jgi:hypothetical protein
VDGVDRILRYRDAFLDSGEHSADRIEEVLLFSTVGLS